MEMLQVLHVTKDDKFFDNVFMSFESDHRLENRAVMEVADKKNYTFRRIKKIEKVVIVEKDEIREIFQKGKYDIIYFYSMPLGNYKYFRWIPQDKVIIWWCWGFELYQIDGCLKPLIPLCLYKPMTQKLLDEMDGGIIGKMKKIVGRVTVRPFYKVQQKRMLKRVDYFQPVLTQEYELMCKIKGFHAKEFYYPNRFTYDSISLNFCKNKNGSILMGNSQAPTNNHLDVWRAISPYLPEQRKIIIPINYLGDKKYAAKISAVIKSDKHNLCFLRDFMPRDDYFNMMENCSYAVFGVIRQQAMGNVYYCLSHGIKVFFYKDSLVYRFLKEDGYFVYAIEDIDKNSFSQPMTMEEIKHNKEVLKKKWLYREEVKEKAFSEMLNYFNKQ